MNTFRAVFSAGVLDRHEYIPETLFHAGFPPGFPAIWLWLPVTSVVSFKQIFKRPSKLASSEDSDETLVVRLCRRIWSMTLFLRMPKIQVFIAERPANCFFVAQGGQQGFLNNVFSQRFITQLEKANLIMSRRTSSRKAASTKVLSTAAIYSPVYLKSYCCVSRPIPAGNSLVEKSATAQSLGHDPRPTKAAIGHCKWIQPSAGGSVP